MPFSHGSYGNVGKVAYQKKNLKSISLVRIFQPHVGEYAIHGAYGIYLEGEKKLYYYYTNHFSCLHCNGRPETSPIYRINCVFVVYLPMFDRFFYGKSQVNICIYMHLHWPQRVSSHPPKRVTTKNPRNPLPGPLASSDHILADGISVVWRLLCSTRRLPMCRESGHDLRGLNVYGGWGGWIIPCFPPWVCLGMNGWCGWKLVSRW